MWIPDTPDLRAVPPQWRDGPQTVKKPIWGGLEGPQVLQNEIVSPGFAGRAGSLRPAAQTFLTLLAKKAGADGLFRHAEGCPSTKGRQPFLACLSAVRKGHVALQYILDSEEKKDET